MSEYPSPRTRLEQVLSQRHLTVDDFRLSYERVSGEALSERQAYRWVAGALRSLPYPRAQAGLEQLFGEPASRLLGPPHGVISPLVRSPETRPHVTRSEVGRECWQGQLVARSAERARAFLSVAEERNVGNETIDQLADDARRLVRAYQVEPLEALLQDISEVQARAFGFLEGRQRPKITRDLYLMAGVASGLMAKASHDLASPHEALTHARAAYTCADNAEHDGLRAWTRGLQSLITYWSGRLDESLRYARYGADSAKRSVGTSAVWLASNEARVLAALGRSDEALRAIDRATAARESAQADELDELGGFCNFNRPRQLYYAADAMRWCGRDHAEETERLSVDALAAYENAKDDERAFGDEAGVRCALAVARIEQREVEGAAEALTDVFLLPASKRIYGVVSSTSYVQRILTQIEDKSPRASQLVEELHDFSSTRLAIPS
jgi:hypothetical protein